MLRSPARRPRTRSRLQLNRWASEQDSKPQFRFSTAGAAASDPGDNTEAVGDIDAVRATALGLKNLQRVADMLLTATTGKQGEPYDELTEVYGRLVGQWTTEMNHVTQLVGGFMSQQKHIGQTGVRFTSVPKARQAEAVKFLLDNAFQTPQFMVRPDILRLIQPTGAIAQSANGAELRHELPAADGASRPPDRSGGNVTAPLRTRRCNSSAMFAAESGVS